MANVYFIADTHFGHRAICKYRPQFSSPKEHDEFIIENWNNKVRNKDLIWVLGDMCIQNKEYDFKKLLKRLKGNINLIPGNHDWMPAYDINKIRVMNGLYSKYKVWLSHCPIHPVELRGKKNVHGHVHYKLINDDNYICVCCEHINYTPISLAELREKKNETI